MDELFDKLINDELSSSELKDLREHFNAETDEELISLIRSGDFENSEVESVPQTLLDKVKRRIDHQLFYEETPKRRSPLTRIFKIIAAVLLPLILAGAGIWYFADTDPKPSGICTVATAGQETSSLTLPDGTRIKINGNSSLIFPSAFEKSRREVSFNGEAYFEVSKDPESPFTIMTPTMTVTVKGTAFNLMSRAAGKYSELSLDSGSVTVKQTLTGNSVDVSPGTKLIVDNATGQMILKPMNAPQENSSWTSMELYFENASPAYLVDRIEQTYNIKLDSNIKKNINDSFTGTLPANDLDETLRIINRIYGM